MIVDDSPVFRPSAQALLERRGYQVVGASSSMTAAVPLARALRPTGALVDVLLPDGCGFDLVARLERAAPGIAVLMMSTHDHDGTAYSRAESSGARGFVLKSQLASCDLGTFLPPR
ncbi:MAG TPA: response regulator transcription factor [Thermoleophilaceae bacterium]|nr:response regulator transcription factor [Thermoleophilaceae bacterium]